MSLTGNLEIFPMPEVLRLLSRSKKTGCLSVDAGIVSGSVYLSGGAITFANTGSDDSVRQALVNAGLIGPDALLGAGDSIVQAAVTDIDTTSITDFVREHVVESLYRIRKPGHGDFEFDVDVTPTFETDQQFDSEVAVAESERRSAEWDDILGTIDDLDAPIRMVRQLSDDNSVTIAAPTWKVLASLEGGTSVRELAYRTGMSEFRAARELSGLIRSELVTIAESVPRFDSGYQAPVIARTAIESVEDSPEATDPAGPSGLFTTVDEPGALEPESTWELPAWEAPADSVETDAAADDWSADVADDESDSGDEELDDPTSDTDDVADEGQGATSHGGWWAAAAPEATESTSPVEDPDSFLESVFSQLNEDSDESVSSDDDETGFSMGLLRRRRMGAAARDITES